VLWQQQSYHYQRPKRIGGERGCQGPGERGYLKQTLEGAYRCPWMASPGKKPRQIASFYFIQDFSLTNTKGTQKAEGTNVIHLYR
jgi:hypothetical protein